jgi:hypothetical protein
METELHSNNMNREGDFSESGIEASHLWPEKIKAVSHQGINPVP